MTLLEAIDRAEKDGHNGVVRDGGQPYYRTNARLYSREDPECLRPAVLTVDELKADNWQPVDL